MVLVNPNNIAVGILHFILNEIDRVLNMSSLTLIWSIVKVLYINTTVTI